MKESLRNPDNRRVTVDLKALVELINAINEVHDIHPFPDSQEMKNLLEWKRVVWKSMKNTTE